MAGHLYHCSAVGGCFHKVIASTKVLRSGVSRISLLFMLLLNNLMLINQHRLPINVQRSVECWKMSMIANIIWHAAKPDPVANMSRLQCSFENRFVHEWCALSVLLHDHMSSILFPHACKDGRRCQNN